MYNLAKLLTDEPEKLERLIILFLKLLITFLAAIILLGFDLSFSSIIKDPIPETYSASKLLYFFTCFILLWFFFWTIIEGLLYELPVYLFSKGANTRTALMQILSFIDVVKLPNYDLRKKIPRLIHPGKHIGMFVEGLKVQQEERFIEKNTSRLKQYYILIGASLTLLLASKDVNLSCGQIICALILIVGLLIGCIIFRQLQLYINNNFDVLLREFEPMAYSQMVHQTIKEETFIERNYLIPEESWGKQVVNLKTDSWEPFPKQIKIIPAYHWNEPFAQQMLEVGFEKRKSKNRPVDYPCIDLYISNIRPSEAIQTLVKSQNALVYIYAINEREIFEGLEETYYKLQKLYHQLEKKRKMAKIISDTNIWYKIAGGSLDNEKLQELNLVATFNNIKELAKTPNLIDKYDFVAETIRSIFHYQKEIIYVSPFIHIAKLKNPEFAYDVMTNMGSMLEFTQRIASGDKIKSQHKAEFTSFIESMRKDLEEVTAPWNDALDQIKAKITNKKAHKKEDATEVNRALISHMVEVATKGEVSLKDGFDWSQIELLEKTMSAFFLELEISGMKIDENDWFDLFLLAYVQPGNLIWTYEKRWINMIRDRAKLGSYLFDPSFLEK